VSSPAPATPPPVTTPVPPGTGDPVPQTDYQERLRRFQAVHQQTVEQHKTEKAQLEAQIAQLTGTSADWEKKFGALETEHTATTASLATATAEAATVAAELLKLQLISADAPHLAAYAKFIRHVSEDGTVLEADAIKAQITEFGKLLGDQLKQVHAQFQQGYVPGVPPQGADTKGTPGEFTREEAWAVVEKFGGRPGLNEEQTEQLATAKAMLKKLDLNL
jgi:hypothetical protein